MERLKPLNDFIFKKLFGEKGDEPVLIAFLNAVLQKTHREELTSIVIKENTELTKELINDKMGRIDVRATTKRGEEIDIEVQIANQNNMDKRTLFYWSKLYLEGIQKGDDYKTLSKVITINIVDFEFLDTPSYHSSYHLWEDEEKNYMLTDLVEIHFIELPKFRRFQNKNYKENSLQRWLAFLETDVSKNMLEELMHMEPAIRMAEEKLDFLSSDPHTIELYKARENSAHEKANIYSSGKEQGEKETQFKIARALLDILDDEMITLKTGLDIEDVRKLRSGMTNS